MSLSFLRSHSLSFFLWLVIKHSKGYFQSREPVAGPVPSRVGRSSPARRPRHVLALSEKEQKGALVSPLLAPDVSTSLVRLPRAVRAPCPGCPHPGRPRRGAEPKAPIGSCGVSVQPWHIPATDGHRSKSSGICEKVVQITEIRQRWRR